PKDPQYIADPFSPKHEEILPSYSLAVCCTLSSNVSTAFRDSTLEMPVFFLDRKFLQGITKIKVREDK
ncbi:MAG TPA: hypothetical protein P5025_06620, partial [Candidatus Ratteibacteria bacterium]|nr:hypothetical protein [Candidatus Ratteibacteria bacterium]